MANATLKPSRIDFSVLSVGIFVGVFTLLAILISAWTSDRYMAIHAPIGAIVGLVAIAAICFWAAGIKRSIVFDPHQYEDTLIKFGVGISMFWGVVGILVGVVIAAQLTFPNILYFPDFGFLNFGRLRPLHTSAVIFAFGGNVLLTTSFHVVQRTCRTRLAGGLWPWFVFWGYQVFILLAATGYVMGVSQGREYAEPEWYVDLWLTVVWVAYLLVFLGTIWKRKEPHIYVANWFLGAFMLTVAVLHIGNSMAIPVSFTKSYSLYAGAVDAMMQWWYGHNAVGFFLTAGFPSHFSVYSRSILCPVYEIHEDNTGFIPNLIFY